MGILIWQNAIRIRSEFCAVAEIFLQVKGTLPCKIHDNNTVIHSQPVHLGREQNTYWAEHLLLFKQSVSPQSIWICSVKIEISGIYTGLKFPREPMFPLSERKCFSSVVFLLLSLSVLWLASWLCLSLYAWSNDRKKGQPEGTRKRAWRGLVRFRKVGEIQTDWQNRQEKRAETSRGRQILTEGAAQRNLLHTHAHTDTHTGLCQLVAWHLIALRGQHSHAHK